MANKAKRKVSETRIIDGELVGKIVMERTVKVPLDELTQYVNSWGFKHEGSQYFRITWMNPDYVLLFRSAGLIEEVGSLNDLRNSGVKVPDEFSYDGKGAGSIKFYRVSDNKVNIPVSSN